MLRTNGINCDIAVLPHGFLARRKLFELAVDFDGVFLHKKGVNLFDAFWLKRYSKKIIYNFDDAVMYKDKKPEFNSLSHFIPFRRSVKLADMVIVGCSYLADHARRFSHNVKILPLGINVSEYQVACPPESDDKIRLVWIGSGSTLSYLEQIKPVLEEIGSRFDNVILRIIADVFFDLQNMKVEKKQWSKKTRALDLVTGDIGLAPLPDNRFTRGKCSFKVLEYLSAGLPTVASPVGTNPDYVRDNITGFLVRDSEQWIAKISQLIEQKDLRKQIGDAARTVAEEFDSNVIGKKLSVIITEFIKESSSSAEQIDLRGIQSVTTSATGKPKVSVCIPAYNRKDYLRETLDSILAQTCKDYEIIVVDDGSTDGTENMIRELDFPVTYHWQENSGDAAARNKLVQLARGRYILFIDSDDLLLPDAVERLVKVMETETEDIIAYGSYLRIDRNSNVYGRSRRRLYSGNITKHLFKTICVHFGGSMFPRKILKEFPIFDTSLKVCSDYDFWLRLSTKYRFIALSNPAFKRRRHSGNLSTNSFENYFTELKVLKRFYYENGGKEVVPKRIAMRRLGKGQYRAGKCAVEEGNYQAARNLLRRSFRRHPSIKSAIQWLRAVLMNRLQ